MNLVSIIPLLTFILFFYCYEGFRTFDSRREVFLASAVSWGISVWIITETLSFFRILNQYTVGVCWLGIFIATISIFYRKSRLQRNDRHERKVDASKPWLRIELFSTLILISVVLILLPALFSAPNTWDAMTYHLSRIMHWQQNQTLAHYPTHIIRQLYINPWAEYAILQFQLLNQNDAFANLIQWFSLLGSLVGVSAIAKLFGASSRGQVFASLATVSIPMAILQGSSTQNDIVVTFWLISFVYFVVKRFVVSENNWLLPTGASLGLAVLTKATAYIFAFPYVIWLLIQFMKDRQAAKLVRQISIVALLALLINFGHYARNYQVFGNPLGPENQKLLNIEYSVGSLISNSVRNLSLHLGTTTKINIALKKAIIDTHEFLQIDVNNPETTYPNTRFEVFGPTMQEDIAGNFIHLLVGAIVSSTYLVDFSHGRDRENWLLKPYLICLLFGFLLFCLLLKWQPWHSRLHLPLFVLVTPVIGRFMEDLETKKLANLVMIFIWFGSLPWLFNNYRRPLWGAQSVLLTNSVEQTFRPRPEARESYEDLIEFMLTQKCTQVGLVTGGDSWEYPLWTLLKSSEQKELNIEHVFVDNESQQILSEEPFSSFSPCLWIALDISPQAETPLLTEAFDKVWQRPGVMVFTRD
jgi:hypothetical protein